MVAMSYIPRMKRFNNKTYKLIGIADTRKEALQQAKGLRKVGTQARVCTMKIKGETVHALYYRLSPNIGR
jgi:hypothetical protein